MDLTLAFARVEAAFRQSRIVLEGTQARPAPSLGGDPVPVRPAPSIGSGLLPVRPAPRLKSGRRQRRLSASKVLELTGGGGSTAHQPGFRAARVAPVQPGAERAALEMFAPTRRAPLPSAWRTQTWEPLPTTWRPAPAPPSPVRCATPTFLAHTAIHTHTASRLSQK